MSETLREMSVDEAAAWTTRSPGRPTYDLAALGRLALIEAKAEKIAQLSTVYPFGAFQRRAGSIIVREAREIIDLALGLPDDAYPEDDPDFIPELDE